MKFMKFLQVCQREAFHSYQLAPLVELRSVQLKRIRQTEGFSNQAHLIWKPATLEKSFLWALSQLDAWIKSEGFWEMFHLPHQILKVEVINWLSIDKAVIRHDSWQSSGVAEEQRQRIARWELCRLWLSITALFLNSVPSLLSPTSEPVP